MKLKQELHNLCLQYLNKRIQNYQQAISDLNASAEEETGSSAGDKYETARSMMQLDIEKNTEQLDEAKKLRNQLVQLSTDRQDLATPGAVVITTQGNYYLSVSAGQFKVQDQTYFAVSPGSPIGAKLLGSKVGDTFSFNNRNFEVKSIL